MSIIRALGYTGQLQRLTITEGFAAEVNVYVWGAGGGGSGGDSGGSRRGGNGSGGGYSVIPLSVSAGDILDIAVGQGGGLPGGSASQGGTGSFGGLSYTNFGSNVYGGVASVGSSGQYFSYGLWTPVPPGSGFYTVTANDNSNPTSPAIQQWFVVINGVLMWNNVTPPPYSGIYVPGTYRGSVGYSKSVFGSATLNAFDLTYASGTSYCGGSGGASLIHTSGAGGGGGGASVVLFNGTVVGYASGGGGGGGCGNTQGAGSDAPGPNGQDPTDAAGSNGQSWGVGGGGGGGGGGNGGNGNISEGLAQAGAQGRNEGTTTANPSGTKPGGTTSAYYAGTAGYGGLGMTRAHAGLPGSNGYAVVELVPKSILVKSDGIWNSVQKSYVKNNNAWKQINATFVKQNGTWTPVVGANSDYAPNFENVSGYFSAIPRGLGG